MSTHKITPDQKQDNPPAKAHAPAPDIAAVVEGAARELHDSAWDYDGPTMDKGKGVKEITAILTRHLAPLVERLERAERERDEALFQWKRNIDEHAKINEAMVARLATLEADKKRLDWMEGDENHDCVNRFGAIEDVWYAGSADQTLRAAIDHAMQEKNEK